MVEEKEGVEEGRSGGRRGEGGLACPQGHPNPREAKFCGFCGAKLVRAEVKGEEEVVGGQAQEVPIPSPAPLERLGPLKLKAPELFFLGIGGLGVRLLGKVREMLLEQGRERAEDSFEFLGLDSEFPTNLEELALPAQSLYKVGRKGQGTGHLWKAGERMVSEDASIKELLLHKGIDKARALYLLLSLGGGMGSGAAPYLLSRLPSWGCHMARIALALYPAHDEPDQTHFNAYCGLARLLRYRMRSNVDMVILVGNGQLSAYRAVNRWGRELSFLEVLGSIVSLMTLPGDAGVHTSINISDMVTYERSMRAFHFVPCLAMGHSMRIYSGLTGILESAFSRPLMELDADTVLITYLHLRLSKSLRDVMPYDELVAEFDLWRRQNLPLNKVAYLGLSYTNDETDKVDALLLLGGYQLLPTLRRSRKAYLRIKDSAMLSDEEARSIEETYEAYDFDLRSTYRSSD